VDASVCLGPRARASPTAVPSGGCRVRWVCRSAPHRSAILPRAAAGLRARLRRPAGRFTAHA